MYVSSVFSYMRLALYGESRSFSGKPTALTDEVEDVHPCLVRGGARCGVPPEPPPWGGAAHAGGTLRGGAGRGTLVL